MFNLRSDLKIYTSDKYLLTQRIIKHATPNGARYTFEVSVQIKSVPHRHDSSQLESKIMFSPKDCNQKQFREVMELAGINLYTVESIDSFHQWAKANPAKTWIDFQNGIDAQFSVSREKLDSAFAKIRPDAAMNDLALSPNSKIAGLIGKGNQAGYRRRRQAKSDRQNQLIRLWALFGVEVAMSAASKDLETILNGIVLHDFGITHCESMQSVIDHVSQMIRADRTEVELADSIKQLDALIAGIGGKSIERSRPRSPFIRQVYDLINPKI